MGSKAKTLDKSKSMDTLRRILSCIAQYKRGVMLSLLLALTAVTLILYVPILIGRAVDQIVSTGHMSFLGLTTILWKILGTVGLTAAAQQMMDYINNTIIYRVVKDIRTRVFNYLEIFLLGYIDSHSSGDIISRVIADVDQFSESSLMGFTQSSTDMLTTVGTLLFMFSVHPAIILVVILLIPISLFMASFIAKRTFVMFRHQSVTKGELTALTDEMPRNIRVVQAFGYREEAQRRFEEINNRLVGCSLRATFFSSITNPATRFINSMTYAVAGITGTYAAIRGFMTVGQSTGFLSYANQYTKPFDETSGAVTEPQNALISAARVFKLIDEKTILAGKPDAMELKQMDGRVELEHVDFSYTPDRKLIGDFSLLIESGWRVAIVGPTGCGKITIIDLLMRFYDVNNGVIRVEGGGIRGVTRKNLRTNYNMVLQETWLKSGTIRGDTAYGRPDATEDEVIQTTREVHAHGFITRVSKGYDTAIRESGGSLPRGQKQLFCIARVMFCLPPMLMLDGATFSINTGIEIRIQKAFAKMMEGRTNFIIAHRLSTIREADVILVIRDSHIVEEGRHEELLEKNGLYAEICNSQLTRAQPDIRSKETAGRGFGHRSLISSRLPAPQI